MKKEWVYKKLGEVCEIRGRIGFRGYTKSDLVSNPKDGAITLSPSNIINGEMNFDKCTYISWAKYDESPEIKIRNGDILLVKTASVGKTAIVRTLPHKATINPQFVVFKNIKIDNYFLSYFLKSQIAQKFIWSIAKGAAAQTVSQKNLSELRVPVPSLSEQQRIVSYLDAEFAKIEALNANAEKQLQAAKDLFQAALKDLMTPKEGWVEKKLGEICEILDSKRKPITKSKRQFGEIPYYGATGLLDYVKDFIFDEKLVLLGEDGAKWGAGDISSYIINGKSWVNNHAHVLRPKRQYIIDEFLTSFLNFTDLSDFITGVTVPKLNQEKMRSIIVPLPSLSEQKQIAAKLDELCAKIKAFQTNYTETITLCNDLKQALLKQVFE